MDREELLASLDSSEGGLDGSDATRRFEPAGYGAADQQTLLGETVVLVDLLPVDVERDHLPAGTYTRDRTDPVGATEERLPS